MTTIWVERTGTIRHGSTRLAASLMTDDDRAAARKGGQICTTLLCGEFDGSNKAAIKTAKVARGFAWIGIGAGGGACFGAVGGPIGAGIGAGVGAFVGLCIGIATSLRGPTSEEKTE